MKTRMLSPVFLVLVLAVNIAFGWGNATHTLFLNQLGAQSGPLNDNEVYGSVLTDAFNLILEPPGVIMADQLHYNFAPLVQRAQTCAQKATVLGVGAHNGVWGADVTAHYNSFSFPGQGYAIVKGAALAPSIVAILVPILMNAGLEGPTATAIASAIAPEFGHDLSETAVDLWVKRAAGPSIGAAMVGAAQRRSSDVGQLLADTYAAGLATALNIPTVEARKFIMKGEREFRDQAMLYGRIFTLPEEQAIAALSTYYAAVAAGFIKAVANVEVTIDPALVGGMLVNAMSLVAGDFQNEIAQTLAFVQAGLTANGITGCTRPAIATREISASSLGENFPNPFNPSTTLTFSIPVSSPVTLEIFNALGQKVRTLLDARMYEPGTWNVAWDGRNDAGTIVPSGTYVSRLTTQTGVSSRTMIMLK